MVRYTYTYTQVHFNFGNEMEIQSLASIERRKIKRESFGERQKGSTSTNTLIFYAHAHYDTTFYVVLVISIQ